MSEGSLEHHYEKWIENIIHKAGRFTKELRIFQKQMIDI